MKRHDLKIGVSVAIITTVALEIPTSLAAFKPLHLAAMTSCDVKLTQISNIPYQCWKFKDRDAKLAVWEDSIGFSFGLLEQSQWQQIAQAYGQGSPIASYDPNKEYWLIDFLPPLIQATNQHRFESEISPAPPFLSSKTDTTTILSNCWGTLYELLRLQQHTSQAQTYLMMVPPNIMLSTLQSFSKPVTQPQPGDFLIITHSHGNDSLPASDQRTYFDHGALYVDKNLLFEKAGAGDAVPYRLIDSQTIQQIWRPDVFSHQIRRPIPHHRLPHPHSFSTTATPSNNPADKLHQGQWTEIQHDNTQPSQKQAYAIVPLPALSQIQGRYVLDPQTYTSEYYQEKLRKLELKTPSTQFQRRFQFNQEKHHEN